MKYQTERQRLVLTAQRHQTVQIFAHRNSMGSLLFILNPGEGGGKRTAGKHELVSSPISEESAGDF